MHTLVDLTDRFPLTFDLERMQEEVRWLESTHNWIGHYDASLADGWTAVPLVSHDGSMNRTESQRIGQWGQYRRTAIVDSLPYFKSLLDAFECPHGRIRIMRMNPGTVIRPHRDVFKEVANFAFSQVRLHIPIFTNRRVSFVVDGQPLFLHVGRLYYVNFSKVHHVRNDGDAARTHLVLDLKVNSWLRSIFPASSIRERVQDAIVRNTLPAWWYAEAAAHVPARYGWRVYEKSGLRAMRHRYFPKAVKTTDI